MAEQRDMPQVYKDRYKKYSSDPENKAKLRARWLVQYHVKKGNIIPKACEECGSAKTQGHHPDYKNKKQVKWLCSACHKNEHRADICKNGHAMDGANIRFRADRNSARYCVACQRNAQKNYMRRKRAGSAF